MGDWPSSLFSLRFLVGLCISFEKCFCLLLHFLLLVLLVVVWILFICICVCSVEFVSLKDG